MWPKQDEIYCFLFLFPSLGLKRRTLPLRGAVFVRLGGDRTRPAHRVGTCLEDVRGMNVSVREREKRSVTEVFWMTGKEGSGDGCCTWGRLIQNMEKCNKQNGNT